MSIAPGSQLGPYEVLSPLGAGGMGEVYKARDTRLDRTVAVKVLPEHLSQDPTRRERFEREARAVSSLNHPHICTLHDVGEHEGVHFLVMEHIEGETLADRLNRGALPLSQALEYAAQIAGALDKAHRAGIVHRDLKPGNIMLTKPGVKLLDFGLATRLRQGFGEVKRTEGSEQPTQHKPLTDAGTILGTVQYMAPEQLEGKEVDARADLFALGAIVFEMITGRRAFEGESQASLISAIMSSDPPPVSALQPVSPPALDRVVKKCLAKDPDERWHSAHDIGTQLEWMTGSDIDVTPTSARNRSWLPWVVAGLAALTALVLSWGSNPEAPAPAVSRLETGLVRFSTGWAPGMALSPDGKYLVYRSAPPTELRVRPLASLTTYVLEGSENGRNPFFSPDGQWVAFATPDQIKKVSIEGGRPQVVGELPAGPFGNFSGTWSANGTILVTNGSGLYRYSADGEPRETILELEATTGTLLHPHWLPDERHALVTLMRGSPHNSIRIVDVATGNMQELIESGSQASYLPSGHLIYRVLRGGTSELHGAAFDVDKLSIEGPATPIPDPIFAFESAGGGFFTISPSGHLAYLRTGTTDANTLVWTDSSAATTVLDIDPGGFNRPSLSPDGRRLAVDSHVGGAHEHDIWIYDAQTGARTRFTIPGHNGSPVWTQDGAWLAFSGTRPPEISLQSIYRKRSDNATPAELLVAMEFPAYPVSFSPDGKILAFVIVHRDTQDDVWVLSFGEEPEPLVATRFNEHSPMFSPDGRWLAYVSDESGREEVYVRPFPGEGSIQAVSTSGGEEPMWSRDGRKLFFRDVRGPEMWSVDVELEPTFRAAKPELLFSRTFLTESNRRQTYDVAPDGRFLMVEKLDSSAEDRAVIVLNWAEELKRLVPKQ